MRVRLLVIAMFLATASSVSAEPIGFWQLIEHPGDMTNIVQTGDAGTMYLDFDFAWDGGRQIWDGHQATFGFPAGTVSFRRGMDQSHPDPVSGLVNLALFFSSALRAPWPDPTTFFLIPGPFTGLGSDFVDFPIHAGDAFHLSWDQTGSLLGEQWRSVFTFNGTIGSAAGGGTGHGTLIITSVPEPPVLYLAVAGLATLAASRIRRRVII